MSFLVPESVKLRRKVTFVSIEEARRLPIPIRPINREDWARDLARGMWERMCAYPWMLSDETKQQFRDVLEGTRSGAIHWFEIGDGLGYAHVFNIDANGIGEIVLELVGSKRAFLRKYGDLKGTRRVTLAALFKWLKLRKLRAFIVADNEASMQMAVRCGFEVEGLLKKEWFVNGEAKDVYVLGLLEENSHGEVSHADRADGRSDQADDRVLHAEDGEAGPDVPGAAASGDRAGEEDGTGDHGPEVLLGGAEAVRPGPELH